MNIRVSLKSGKTFELTDVVGTIDSINKELNRNKFIYFGPLILNCDQIESITKTS